MPDPDTLHFIKTASGVTEDVTQAELETVADWTAIEQSAPAREVGTIEYSGTVTGSWGPPASDRGRGLRVKGDPVFVAPPRHPATSIGE